MFGVIKSSSPAHPIVIEGDKKVGGNFPEKTDIKDLIGSDDTDKESAEENKEKDEIVKITKSELDAIRAQYRMDGELFAEEMRVKSNMEFAHAKEQAEKIVENAEEKANDILSSAEERVNTAAEQGRKQGYDEGYKEAYVLGDGKGREDGYTHAQNECRAAIKSLQEICSSLEKERNQLMTENRRAIFDMAMEIAQKITMTVFTQKDKGALQRMITNAAKDFRKAKTVKVTVSRLDLSDNVETDLKAFEKCFSPTSEVSFEVIEDGEKGTLQIETESEILDAGVSTQLKMIEELGSGKYRDAEPEKATVQAAEAAEQNSAGTKEQVPVTDDEDSE